MKVRKNCAFKYQTVFEVQIHLSSMQECQETLKVTAVIDFYHGFCFEFLRERRERLGSQKKGRCWAERAARRCQHSPRMDQHVNSFTVTRQQVPWAGEHA